MTVPLTEYVETHIEKSFARIEGTLKLNSEKFDMFKTELKAENSRRSEEMKKENSDLIQKFDTFKTELRADNNVFKKELENFISTTMMAKAFAAAGLLAGGLLALGSLIASFGVKWTPPQMYLPTEPNK